ncbi:hypothetical protein BBD42_07060 [Paenibacillus sp. BIHB 4019]|uniref:ATP-grasp domain-containing protein n=1 Tax=Paenibacillus sp. BIHB 4019 TaxID=1870819 RepID=A0A1B2DEV6_9BACL|nr:YheC/YheD family protein [Paenibacillus sp. BIHB 4019]ANY66251.1 hypothetical protein BBD42_07060 [Paenibacillus sp. BIHB 4019]
MGSKCVYVGILVANRNQRKYVLKQYLPYATADMKIFCFTPHTIRWESNKIIGLHRSNRKWALSKFPFPQVVYNRCYLTNFKLIERLQAVIGPNKCFNPLNQLNKLEIHNHLSKWLVDYLPVTMPFEQANLVPLLEFHKMLYFKPYYGNKGNGVYRAELLSSGEIHIGHHYFSPTIILRDAGQLQSCMQKLVGSTPYLIQAGVHIRQVNHQNFDIRALVQKNEQGLWSVTNVISRIAHKGSYNTSICEKACLTSEILNQLFPPQQTNAIIQSIYNVSLRSAEILDDAGCYHLGEFSVDLALDQEGHIWIIELNGKPQKNLYDGIRQSSAVYKRPIEYAHYLGKS